MTNQLKSSSGNNNYYGFSTSSRSPSDSDNNPVGSTAGAGLQGGGLSFIIHSNANANTTNQQLGSISSISSSSGISSGSSTITKSSAFNGNTFTRSKPKERKPIHTYFNQEQEEDVNNGPFAKGIIIPTVTLSPDTPPSAPSVSSSSASSSDHFYFNSNSSSGTIFQHGLNGTGEEVKETGKGKRNFNVSSSSTTSSDNFQPGACSTFILADGEEFPEDIGASAPVGNSTRISSSGRRVKSSSGTANSSSDKSEQVINGIGQGTKMREQQLSVATNGLVLERKGDLNRNSSGNDSNVNGEEENFECFGEGSESFTLETGSGDTSLQYSRDGTDLDLTSSGLGGASTPLSRNSWTRTSLRKSPQNNSSGDAMGYRKWGSLRNAPGTKRIPPPVVTSSNALANQLYRSSSFHSSGRSSAGDAEEMYSDGSLEDEVIDLTHKVHHLEEKMTVLAENQSDADDRYTREKEKNAELSTKVFMLEEQLRETELRGDEKLREEQRRFKEFQSRCDREKQLQNENYEIRLQSMEKELASSKTEATRSKNQLERERSDKDHYSDKCLEMERELSSLREENRFIQEQGRRDRETSAMESAGAQQTLLDLKREVESMRQFQMQSSPSSLRRHEESIEEAFESQELKSRVKEYEEEIRKLKRLNQQLQDGNDELNAQLLNRGLEEGRTLLTTINSVPAGDSLAAEFEAMSQDQSAIGFYDQSETDLVKIKKALKEQVEVNDQLRNYIDGILLIIVENNPQLLEVKNSSGGSPSKNNNDKCHQPMSNGV